jgi:hypothetical protein
MVESAALLQPQDQSTLSVFLAEHIHHQFRCQLIRITPRLEHIHSLFLQMQLHYQQWQLVAAAQVMTETQVMAAVAVDLAVRLDFLITCQ